VFNVIIAGIASLLTDMSTEMVYPIIPLYLTMVLKAQPLIVGLIEGVSESAASLLKVFSGYWSDKIQRRKPIAIAGYAASTFGKVFLYLSNAWGWVFTGRLIDRLGKGVRNAPRDALLADSTPPDKRGVAFGLHRAFDTLGAAAGVLVAFFALRHVADAASASPYKRLFLISLIPAGLGVGALFFVREVKLQLTPERKRLLAHWKELPRRLKLFLVVVLLFALGNSSNQFLILRATHLGVSVPVTLLLYLFYNLTYAALAYPAGRLSDRIGRKKILVAGYVFYGLVYIGFALARAPVWLWALFGVYGLFSAFNEGIEKALVSDIAPPEIRGTLIGLHSTLTGVGLFPASLIAGALMTWNNAAPFWFGGALGLLAAVGLMVVL
jgi:MFS family permease